MTSSIEKENSSNCVDTNVSKAILPPTQSSPKVNLFHKNSLKNIGYN